MFAARQGKNVTTPHLGVGPLSTRKIRVVYVRALQNNPPISFCEIHSNLARVPGFLAKDADIILLLVKKRTPTKFIHLPKFVSNYKCVKVYDFSN